LSLEADITSEYAAARVVAAHRATRSGSGWGDIVNAIGEDILEGGVIVRNNTK